VFPTPAVRELAGLPEGAPLKDVLQSPAVQAHFQRLVEELADAATGSANRVARLHLMHEPPSIDKGEVTDKGSINQRAVLQQRSELVEALHAGTLGFTLPPRGLDDTR
jgi:feruloyl-CoA synthase